MDESAAANAKPHAVNSPPSAKSPAGRPGRPAQQRFRGQEEFPAPSPQQSRIPRPSQKSLYIILAESAPQLTAESNL